MYLVEQDVSTRHWNTLARYFASEGVACGQGLLVVGARSDDPEDFLSRDVAVTTDTLPRDNIVTTTSSSSSSDDGVKIAWRYKAQLLEKSTLSGADQAARRGERRCHLFDLSRSAQEKVSELRQSNVGTPCVESVLYQVGSDLDVLLNQISSHLERYNVAIKDPNVRRPPLCRLLIRNFGSGLWDCRDLQKQLRFLCLLRSLVRRSLCVCIVTVANGPCTSPSVRHLFDQSVAVRSFEGQENETFPGFSGVLTVGRVISSTKPEYRQYLFRRTKRTLHVERFYMPPEDSDSSSSASMLACATTGGAGKNSLLDF